MEHWSFTPVATVYFSAAGVSFLLAFLSWRMRPVRGATLFSLLMLSLSLWSTSYILEVFSGNYHTKLWLLRIEYIGIACAVYVWVLFIARYTHLDKWLGFRVYLVLAIIPVLVLYQLFQAPENSDFYHNYTIQQIKGLYFFEKDYAWGFYIWTGYAYAMLLYGLILLIIRVVQLSGAARKQIMFILPLAILIIITNAFFITNNGSFMGALDPTPLTLVIIGVLVLVGMYYYKFLNVVPVAHNLILKNVKAGVIIIDSRGYIIEINKLAEKIIGLTEKQAIGVQIHQVLSEGKDLVKLEPVKEEIKAERVLGVEKHTYEIRINPLTDNSGVPFGQVIMMWDITDQKMAMDELDAYARTVAHDLKTPLNHVLGYARLFEQDVIREEDKKGALKTIIDSGEKMKGIIDGLLMLAKIRNEDNIDVSPLNMNEIMLSIKQRLSDSLRKSNVELIIPEKLHEALGNAIWIEEVLINLISNAIKYGGTPPKIEIGSEQENGVVKFWVKDNGIGVSKEEQEHLFTEFTRVHPNRDVIQGYGIGLSIVQRAVSKLKGEVGVFSIKGEGSVFFFKLPN